MSKITTRQGAPLAALAAAFVLAACGGGGADAGAPPPPDAPSLTATTDAANATPDGAPVGLHAVVTGANAPTPAWTIVSGPGTLSASTGADVQYIPPSAEAFDEGATVTVSV